MTIEPNTSPCCSTGSSWVEESMLTVEPTPVAKAAGDGVIGASINRSSTCSCALGLATPIQSPSSCVAQLIFPVFQGSLDLPLEASNNIDLLPAKPGL